MIRNATHEFMIKITTYCIFFYFILQDILIWNKELFFYRSRGLSADDDRNSSTR